MNDSFEAHWGAITPSSLKITYYYVVVEKSSNRDEMGDLIKLNEPEWKEMVQSGITQNGKLYIILGIFNLKRSTNDSS